MTHRLAKGYGGFIPSNEGGLCVVFVEEFPPNMPVSVTEMRIKRASLKFGTDETLRLYQVESGVQAWQFTVKEEGQAWAPSSVLFLKAAPGALQKGQALFSEYHKAVWLDSNGLVGSNLENEILSSLMLSQGAVSVADAMFWKMGDTIASSPDGICNDSAIPMSEWSLRKASFHALENAALSVNIM